MQQKRIENSLGWVVSGLALLVYLLTAQRTTSFWDSAEFILTSAKMQPSHPPGAPLYTIMSSVFLWVFPTQYIAFGAAIFSAIFGAATVKFLFHTIVYYAKKVAPASSESGDLVASLAGVVGGLALTYSHTFWVASTEAEVYTVSTFFMALAFWAAMRWEQQYNQPGNMRWLIFIVFVLGLSIGVHIMNLAVLFPIAALVATRLKGFGFKWIAIAFGIALVLFIALNSVLVQGVLRMCMEVEKVFVNSIGLPANSGAVFFAILWLAILIVLYWLFRKRGKQLLQLCALGAFVFTIGWSSFAMVVIRSVPDAPGSNPANSPMRLMSYLRSDQFGFSNRPLFKGPSFAAPLDSKDSFQDEAPIWRQNMNTGTYQITNRYVNAAPNYAKEFDLLFPRMWNREQINVRGYRDWVDFEGNKIRYNGQSIDQPTAGDNFAFFWKYQFMWLNYRYFMWNFAGKQNDNLGLGDPLDGNWRSGIGPLDAWRIGPDEVQPDYLQNDHSNNPLYFLPLILGILGLVWLFKRGKPELYVLGLFFIAFGFAITVFINQLPIHIIIRERDYIFLGAYFAFAVFIGLSVPALADWLPGKLPARLRTLGAAFVCLLAGPVLMLNSGWTDHDRSWDNFPRDLAKSFLDHCEQDALLVVKSDNITFPLMYMQEVEGYRTDVRILNFELLNLDWYVDRLQRQIYKGKPVQLSLPREFYIDGVDKNFLVQHGGERPQTVEVGSVIKQLVQQKDESTPAGFPIRTIPSNSFVLSVDTAAVRNSGIVPEQWHANFTDALRWTINKDVLSLGEIVLLDIINQNKFERPIYFAELGTFDHTLKLSPYFVRSGLVNRLLPVVPDSTLETGRIVDLKAGYKAAMEQTPVSVFSNNEVFHNFYSREMAQRVFRPAMYYVISGYQDNNQPEVAKKIFDHCIASMPNEVVRYDELMFDFGKMAYDLNDAEKGREIVMQIFRNLVEEVRLCTSVEPANRKITENITGRKMALLGIILRELETLDPEVRAHLEPEFLALSREYDAWAKFTKSN